MCITKIFNIFALIGASVLLSGCAGSLPLPGGEETINESFYDSDISMKAKIGNLREGMPKRLVFQRLNRNEKDFLMLSRQEVVSALYGGQPMMQMPSADGTLHDSTFLQSLSGYQLIFKRVERKHGISSPIAMRTDEVGFSYSTILIFKDDKLFEKPVLSGGMIDSQATKTLFDYLSPGTVMGRL